MFWIVLTCQEAKGLSQIVKVLVAHNWTFMSHAEELVVVLNDWLEAQGY